MAVECTAIVVENWISNTVFVCFFFSQFGISNVGWFNWRSEDVEDDDKTVAAANQKPYDGRTQCGCFCTILFVGINFQTWFPFELDTQQQQQTNEKTNKNIRLSARAPYTQTPLNHNMQIKLIKKFMNTSDEATNNRIEWWPFGIQRIRSLSAANLRVCVCVYVCVDVDYDCSPTALALGLSRNVWEREE